jgi:hypothetical protein
MDSPFVQATFAGYFSAPGSLTHQYLKQLNKETGACERADSGTPRLWTTAVRRRIGRGLILAGTRLQGKSSLSPAPFPDPLNTH